MGSSPVPPGVAMIVGALGSLREHRPRGATAARPSSDARPPQAVRVGRARGGPRAYRGPLTFRGPRGHHAHRRLPRSAPSSFEPYSPASPWPPPPAQRSPTPATGRSRNPGRASPARCATSATATVSVSDPRPTRPHGWRSAWRTSMRLNSMRPAAKRPGPRSSAWSWDAPCSAGQGDVPTIASSPDAASVVARSAS